ncbi:MAG: hypothetical protein JXJ20_05045 [Anaerolineae bacterium]|jgi:hypothetical protein|nr:hypothetical protein [Anaerolineae bacterium]
MQRLGFSLAVAVLVTGLSLFTPILAPAAAQTPDDIVAVITSPADGQQLFGLTNITGSASHPTAFASYTLEYDDLSDAAQQWFLVQERVTQQIQDNVLGAWNTNMVPDGVYQLRLRVFLTDGQIGEFIVSNLQVINSEPTPVPTVASGQPDTVPAAPASGPTPTSPIEQPPSNNPSAGDITGLNPAENAPDGSTPAVLNADPGDTSTRINIGRVRSAFCSGAYLAVVAFAVMLGYAVVRGRLRY